MRRFVKTQKQIESENKSRQLADFERALIERMKRGENVSWRAIRCREGHRFDLFGNSPDAV